MGDFGLKRNASGYYDETAYKAIRNIDNEKVQPGDIWMDKDDRDFLILQNHGSFCTVLRLNTEQTRDGEICVKSRSLRWTHPGMMQYCFQTLIKTYVKTLPEDEFEAVLHAVSDALCVTINVKRTEAEDQGKRIAELEQKNRQLAERAAKAETELEEEREKSSVPAGDGIPWKMMYEHLLEKLVGRL